MKSPYRTFIIEWKYEDLDRGIERSSTEEYRVKRLRDSDAEVLVAFSYVGSRFKENTQPRWQGYFIANHAFIWDRPMEFMYSHIALESFSEQGVEAIKYEL
jgi:hypothetical protein